MIDSNWLYKIKHVTYGRIKWYKAKFVVGGFSERKGVDYEETFVAVARCTSIRAIMSIA